MTIISKGLVGYWPFDEGSGMTAFDKSGNGNHGTLENMTEADWVDGKVGKALDFDGDNDYIELPSNLGHYTDTFTIVSWFKTTQINGRPAISRRSGAVAEYDIYILAGGLLSFYDGANSYSGTSDLSDDVWHLGVIVINGANSKIYVDGELERTFSPSISGDAGEAIIGARGGGAAGNFDGLIDEVRIYNRALTEVEIKSLYKIFATGHQASREEKELLLIGDKKEIVFIGRKKPIFIDEERN